MAFGDHRIGVANSASVTVNNQETLARLKNEAKAQNKEVVFVGNHEVKIVPKRNIFEKITDFFNGELRTEKRALKDFKITLPKFQDQSNAKEIKEIVEGGVSRLTNDIEVKTRRAADTFKNTYAKQSESLSKGEIRSTIRDRHATTRADRTSNGILRREGIGESASIIKSQLKEEYHLKPSDFELGKPLESISEESEEEVAENVTGNRDALRISLKLALDDITGQEGSEYSDIQLSDAQREEIRTIAKDLDDSDVDLEKAYAALTQHGISFEGSLSKFAQTKDELAQLRNTTTPARAEAPSASAPQTSGARAQELADNIKSKLSIYLQVYPSTFPDAPAAQLVEISNLKDELFTEKYNNPDETLKLEALESAFQKAGINIEEGLFSDIGQLVQELKTNNQ